MNCQGMIANTLVLGHILNGHFSTTSWSTDVILVILKRPIFELS